MSNTIFDPTRLDFDRPGKRTYEVAFRLDGDWGWVVVPLTVVIGYSGSERNVACFGGTHGDEYEGQVAVRRLAHDLEPEEVSGRVVCIPHLNLPACASRRRESPLDGGNMNRAFPGDPAGTITFRIADFVTKHVLPRVDVVIDCHSGGAAMAFAVLTSFHPSRDPDRASEIQQVAALFDTPVMLLYPQELAGGLLVEEAERQGRIAVGGEFGFGAGVSLIGVRHAYEGMRNVLKHCGVLAGDVVKIDSGRREPPRLLQALDVDDYVPAPSSGIFEPAAVLGTQVERDQLIGRLYDLEQPDRAPAEIRARHPGYLVMHRFQAPVAKGHTLFLVARET